MKTHRERARSAAAQARLLGGGHLAEEAIADETYPTELVDAAGGMLRFASCDMKHRLVTKGCVCTACQYADELRAALTLYDDKEADR